ncbi:MAG: UDP-N-acetylmuramoyl-L-alanyl-D-glutamate--2,6-diaminopimelate ligase [Anaerolineae bacterium]
MKLAELWAALPYRIVLSSRLGESQMEITGISCDSRLVQPGNLFVAIRGVEADGHSFIPDALQKGAVAIVGQESEASIFPKGSPVPYCAVTDSREALAWLAAAWYGYPARKLGVIGVTGTDGKTTTVRLISAILQAASYRVGWISTVSALIGNKEVDTGLHTTTPDAPDMQRYLAQMLAQGAQYVVIEATSHGLAQHRVTACEFDVAVVTNITHEHLNYHGSFEEYRAAKSRLFESLTDSSPKPGISKVAILNADDPSYEFLKGVCTARCYSYGIERPSDIQAQHIHASSSGLSFQVVTPDGKFTVESPLVGSFNVYNILAAIAVGISQGFSREAMQRGILAINGVSGRMERVDLGQNFTVVIDFAHTPNALQNALQTVRTMTQGKVIVVFGCAGLRDRAKRPIMGEIAGRLADYIVLTAEDPRTEDVHDIIQQIAVGCERAGRREGVDYWKIPDRGEAIFTAIAMAKAGDLVIVTGKGHERSMCFGVTEYPWNEREVVEKALRARLGSNKID